MDLNGLRDTSPWDWPKDAGELLMEVLRDRQRAVADRTLAASLAGELVVMDDRMADLLLSILQSSFEPEPLRARAAISLGPALEDADTGDFDDDLDPPAISSKMFDRVRLTLQKLHSQIDAPKEVRRKALEAAIRSPQEWQEGAIRAAFSSNDDDWKLTAIFCMGWIRGFDNEILGMLESRNPDIRREAVRAAGNWELIDAWPHIAALISSKTTEKSLLLLAIGAAATLNLDEATPILLELADSEDEEISEAANEALLGPFSMADDDDEDEDFSD
jgi:hypothetical protein